MSVHGEASFRFSEPDQAAHSPALSDPTSWIWPICQNTFTVYDKYSDKSVELSVESKTWTVLVQGRSETFTFQDGIQGHLQRRLIILTQSDKSPSTICKYARSLLSKWTVYLEILAQGPEWVRDEWDDRILDVDAAKAGKTTLKLACMASVGEWTPLHLALVKALDTRANASLKAQRSNHRRRGSVLPVQDQASIIKVLDEGSTNFDLSIDEVEGLSALALIFQHGVRPVQLIALRTEHIHIFEVAGSDLSGIVSFHAGKKHEEETFEMARQVKPEWISIINRQYEDAKTSERRRLFRSQNRDDIWRLVKDACAKFGYRVAFTPNSLRHTATQSLADDGHSRTSIKIFLGHAKENAATTYIRASQQQAQLLNKALGASKLYDNIISLADKTFVSVAEMKRATEDSQIGAVVGDRLVAGIGLCRTGQSSCPYNPVTSCYGCRKFMPSLDRESHLEAIGGMREQVIVFVSNSVEGESPAFKQLTKALAGAQQALEAVDRISRGQSLV
jgi:integrase